MKLPKTQPCFVSTKNRHSSHPRKPQNNKPPFDSNNPENLKTINHHNHDPPFDSSNPENPKTINHLNKESLVDSNNPENLSDGRPEDLPFDSFTGLFLHSWRIHDGVSGLLDCLYVGQERWPTCRPSKPSIISPKVPPVKSLSHSRFL